MIRNFEHKILAAILTALVSSFLIFANESPLTSGNDKLEFLNGDVLRGKILGIKGNVEFYSELLKSNININSSGIYKINFDSVIKTRTNALGNSVVGLTSGDSFSANFISLDSDKLNIETWFCGRISIPRQRLKSLIPSSGASLIYDGPNGMDGWTIHNPGYFVNVIAPGARQGVVANQPQAPWIFTNNAFYSVGQGAIGRFFELPEKISIDFDISWYGNLGFSIFFFSDTISPYVSSSYMMLFTYRAAYLHRRGNVSGMGVTVLGSVEIPELAKDSKANISIKVDKDQKIIALFVNGKFLQAWKDENDFVSNGKAIVLNQQSVAKLKISNIRITRWDGRIEDTQANTNKITSDIVKLANKDVIEGKVVSITNNLLTIQTDYAKLDIPLDRISSINFADIKQDETAKDVQLVKGFLTDYGSFSFLIEEFSRDKIIGSCPGIGKIVFAPSSFRVLQFNAKEGQNIDETQDIFNEDEMFK